MKPSPLRSLLSSLALCLAVLLAACGTPPPAVPTAFIVTVTPDALAQPTGTPFQPADLMPASSPLPTLAPTLPPAATATQAPTAAPLPTLPPPPGERAGYRLDVTLNYPAHWVSVDETIVYPNQTGQALTALVLAVEPNRWESCFTLIAITVNDLPVANHILTGIRLDLPLPATLEPGQSATLRIHYTLYLPPTSGDNIFGYNNAQVNLVNWYPFVVPYDPARGWLLHQPTEVGEHLVYDVADFDVTLRQSEPALPLVVAASAPQEQGENGWRYRFERARTFALSASTQYQVSSMTIGAVTVNSYYFAGHGRAGEATMRSVAQSLVTYSERFAPYHHTSLSIVEAYFPDGMEYDGLFFLARSFYDNYDGTMQNNLTTIGVHEAAHQWWFGLVGNNQALEPWLDEALCTYSERIFYESNYPHLVYWWWGFRVNSWEPSGWVDTDIYSGLSFRPYTNAAYLRGARFLQALRDRIGDEAFNAFLREYTRQMAYRQSTSADFFRILREQTSVNFADIVTSYFRDSNR
ncbi:MAG: M1 family metallopeptidase [Chloroflexota bacterium]